MERGVTAIAKQVPTFISVPQGKPTLKVRCVLSQTYCFTAEDSDVYSDSEEPHQWYNREEYSQVTKKTKQPREPRTVTIIQPVPVPSTSTAQDSGALKKIATLVQKQKETLEGVGVSLPGPDKDVPAAVTVRTAVPQKKIPALKKGALKCPVCKRIFTQASKCKSHYETNHSYQSKHFCETCQSPFSSQGALDRHKVMHEKFVCHWPGERAHSYNAHRFERVT